MRQNSGPFLSEFHMMNSGKYLVHYSSVDRTSVTYLFVHSRDIVRGVHLKPVSNGSLSANKLPKGRIWNNIALSKKSYETESCEARKGAATTANNYSLNQLPISAQFLNSWQQSDKKSRLLILYKMGPAGLNNIFTMICINNIFNIL